VLVKILNTVTTDQSRTSEPIDLQFVYAWSIQFNWSGTTAGTVKAQISNDGISWTDVPGCLATPAGSTDFYLFNSGDIVGYRYVRSVFTRTSGTGTLDCFVSGKENAVNSLTMAAISNVGEQYVRSTRFITIVSGTSGTITPPSDSEYVLNDFGGETDCVLSQIVGGKPNYSHPLDSGSNIVGSSLDSLGNYNFTATFY